MAIGSLGRVDPQFQYKTQDVRVHADKMYDAAAGSLAQMGQNTKTETEGPGKTLGGGLMAGASLGLSAAGAAATGALGGTAATATAGATGAMGMIPGIGWAAAAIGIASYLFS